MFPSFTSLRADHFSRSNRALIQLTLALILSAFVLAAFGVGSTQAALAPPTLTSEIFAGTSNLISIEGDGFTPGGRVQIVIVDHWGNALHEPVWTMAAPGAPFGAYGMYSGVSGYGDPGSISHMLRLETSAIHGQNGSQDPANGYHAGVDVGDVLDTDSIQVRAFDEYANIWSGFAVVDTDSSLELRRGHPFHYDVPQRCIAIVRCSLPS